MWKARRKALCRPPGPDLGQTAARRGVRGRCRGAEGAVGHQVHGFRDGRTDSPRWTRSSGSRRGPRRPGTRPIFRPDFVLHSSYSESPFCAETEGIRGAIADARFGLRTPASVSDFIVRGGPAVMMMPSLGSFRGSAASRARPQRRQCTSCGSISAAHRRLSGYSPSARGKQEFESRAAKGLARAAYRVPDVYRGEAVAS